MFLNIRAFIFLVVLLVSSSSNALYQKGANDKYYKKFQEVFEKLDRDYVKELEKQELIDAAIEGMLSSLDPHSGYFADDDLEYFVNTTKGEFGGIGVEIIYESGAIKVISIIDDLPAYKANIKAGDYIVKVNNEYVNNLGYNKAVMELRGKPGTKVNLTVFRDGEPKPLELELTREIVKVNAVKTQVDNNIGYVRISTFSEKTMSELKKAFKAFTDDNKIKIQGIILDLRNNPGGLLDQGIAVADYFISDGVIVSTKGRSINSETIFTAAKSSQKAPKLPMIVLINGATISASEIVAGALQDHKRAIILGTRSYGKGSVQTFFPLDDRSAYKFTTALYYTPSGRSIQAEGIMPDIFIENAKVEYPKKDGDSFRFSEASFKNHIKNEQTEVTSKPETKESKEDTQVKSKDPKEKDKDREDPKMSDTYMKDFQYGRAYDLLQGIILLEKENERK